jgi:hypothetical protein
MTIKNSMLTHLAKKEVNSAKSKAIWYDVVFENEDTGVLGLDPQRNPPEVGQVIAYSIKEVKSASGTTTNLVEWPLPPAMRPPAEVVAPVTNPVEASTTEPAEVKAPEKQYKAPDTNRSIVRQVAIKCAVEYHASLPEKPQDPRFQVKAMAEWIEEWVFRSVE